MLVDKISSFRPPFMRAALLGVIVLAPALVPDAAFAQQAQQPQASQPQLSPECRPGIEMFKARMSWIAKIQKMPKKNADPNVACQLFSGLGGANARVLAWAKKNKDWCSIEDDQIAGLEAEAKQVGNIRGRACGAAAQYSKLKAEAQKRARENDAFSVDMSQDPLKPVVKIPPSAL